MLLTQFLFPLNNPHCKGNNRQPADRGYVLQRLRIFHFQIMKPTIVIHPVTGQQCYTKHPEKLLARCAVIAKHGVLHGKQWEDHSTYWNGDSGASKMHRPGEVRS